MANSIKFDNTEILNTTYIPRFIKHESAPDRDLYLVPLAGANGEVLVGSLYRKKSIVLSGILTGNTEIGLENKIDSFKELFSRENKNLDISWGEVTRRYVATCRSHNFDRDHFHLLFVPWTAEFIVPSGIGENTNQETVFNDSSDANIHPIDISPNFGGSAPPKPKFEIANISGSSMSEIAGIGIENIATREQIDIILDSSGLFWHNKAFIIDYKTGEVSFDGVNKRFYGNFPSLKPGSNAIRIHAGSVPAEYYDTPVNTWNGRLLYNADRYIAQSFSIPYTNSTYQTIQVRVYKVGTPPNPLTINIVEDNGGIPDETSEVATASISPLEVGTTVAWHDANHYTGGAFAVFTLEAGKKYWIILKTSGGESTNNLYIVEKDEEGVHRDGKLLQTVNGGANWSNIDGILGFRICYGGRKSSGNINTKITHYARYL